MINLCPAPIEMRECGVLPGDTVDGVNGHSRVLQSQVYSVIP
jgi:hypothetical protein